MTGIDYTTRVELRREIDRRRREQLLTERTRLEMYPAGVVRYCQAPTSEFGLGPVCQNRAKPDSDYCGVHKSHEVRP